MRPSLLAALVALGALSAGCAEWDQAALVEPGAPLIEADPGELRVLRHHDDPTAADQWLEVLAPDPDVVVATERFREADSRDADDDQPADVRLLYEAVAPGRTVLVRLNCRSCDAGVPATDPDETEVLVWDFVVGDAGDQAPTLGDAAAQPGGTHDVAVGEHVVLVRTPDAARDVEGADGEVLRFVARHVPDDGADLLVDVFTAVGAGETTLRYGPDSYVVRVR